MSRSASQQHNANRQTIATSWGWIRWIIEAIALAFVLTFTVPWQPAAEAPIGAFDFSWMLLLHDAVATARQFGTQIILPQGPMGFIGTSVYDPRTYWILIAARTVIAIIAFWSLWEAARKLISHPLIALAWLAGIILLIGNTPDHFFPGCAFLLVMNYFVVHDRRLRPSAVALIIVLAAASLIKVNQPFYAIVAVAALTIDQIIQRRRYFFVSAVTYVACFLLSYFSARQSPSSLGRFVWGWSQVAMGHADAVGLPGPLIDPVAYVVIVAMVLGLVARYEWKTRRVQGVVPLGAVAAVLLLLYKHSFMRQDIVHVHMGPMVVLAAAIAYTPVLWPMAGRVLRGMCLAVICIAAMVLSSILSSYTGNGLLDYTLAAPVRCAANVSAAASHLTDPTRLHRQWESARQTQRDANPLPLVKIHGTVDVYPHRQDVVFAYDLPYDPRPVVSSLVATAPSLAHVNALHLRGPRAAETILFDIELVDQNYPTMLDGESFPDLLTRYDVIDASGAMLVLRRANMPRLYQFIPMSVQSVRFGEAMSIPHTDDAVIWAQVRFKKRTAGRIIAAVYKSPSLAITVHTRQGPDTSYRLLPALAEQGFLLSPLIRNRADYARLAALTWVKDLQPQRVDTITITVDDGSQDASFDPEFVVELKRLEFQRQD